MDTMPNRPATVARPHFRRRRTVSTILVAVAALVAFRETARRFDPLPAGLNGDYFPNTTFTPPSAASRLDAPPSTEHLRDAWHDSPPSTFSATWTGSVLALRDGIYTFATVSDDGSWVYVDGRPIVANGGRHGAQLATGTVRLERGAHALAIQYVQEGGDFHFELQWARDGARLEPVPAWALRPRKVRRLSEVAPSLFVSWTLPPAEWSIVALLVFAVVLAVWPFIRWLQRKIEQTCDWPALRWVLLGSLILNATAIGWGLPGHWVPIELNPGYVAGALALHFSHGWSEAYPPLHYYILSIAISPVLLLFWLGRIRMDGDAVFTVMVLLCRSVSVAMAAGTLVATCVVGTDVFGRRAGVLAAAVFALTAPFLLYAKSANVDVPYIFWFSVSFVFFIRMLQTGHLRDYLLFASAGTLSICTKDQAYGLYLLAPIVIVVEVWRTNRRAGVDRPLWRALRDRRMMAGALAAALVFAACHNLLFNMRGFLDHVRYIVGPGSANYRVYASTAAGHLELLRETVHLIRISMG